MDTYEKKYKEAVNKIRDLLDDGEKNGFTIVTYKTDLESIFPELKESEDEKVRKEIVEYLKKNLRLEWATWLEKQGEQKPAWSEEDERLLNNMIIVIKDYYNDKDAQSLISWLKSLKPQSQWKPSDEQIEILDMVLTNESMDDNIARILRELREQLKKLKGE